MEIPENDIRENIVARINTPTLFSNTTVIIRSVIQAQLESGISDDDSDWLYGESFALYSSNSDFIICNGIGFTEPNENESWIDIDGASTFLVDRPGITTKAAFFDMGGVYHAFDEQGYKENLSASLGCDIDTVEAIWQDLIPFLGSGSIDERTFWDTVHQEYGIKEVKEYEPLLATALGESIYYYNYSKLLIQNLGSRGITLALLTNTIDPHAKYLERSGIYDSFDYKFPSYKMGVRKPDSEIFERALRGVQADPDEVIFIDDKWENVDAAQRFGITRAYQFITTTPIMRS